MKTTISINKEDFNSDAKRMVVITTDEANLILNAIEALETQASTVKALLRSMGITHFIASDNPRTVASMNLTVKGQSDDS
jgi:hypothetical protein